MQRPDVFVTGSTQLMPTTPGAILAYVSSQETLSVHTAVADVFCWMECTGMSVPSCMHTHTSQRYSRETGYRVGEASHSPFPHHTGSTAPLKAAGYCAAPGASGLRPGTRRIQGCLEGYGRLCRQPRPDRSGSRVDSERRALTTSGCCWSDLRL